MKSFFVILLIAVAFAHESHFLNGGDVKMTVGFLVEPAFSLTMNGIDLRVTAGAPNFTTPVTGLQTSVTATVTHVTSGSTRTFPISTVFGSAGSYKVQFFGTASGVYSFRFVGNNNAPFPIDELYTCGSPAPNATGQFGCMLSRFDYEFPFITPDIFDVQNQVDTVNTTAQSALTNALNALSQVMTLNANVQSVNTTAQSALGTAQQASQVAQNAQTTANQAVANIASVNATAQQALSIAQQALELAQSSTNRVGFVFPTLEILVIAMCAYIFFRN